LLGDQQRGEEQSEDDAEIFRAWYAGKGKLMVNLLGSLFCLILVLGLDLWLIPGKGIRGAAIASSIAYGSTALYYVTRFCLSTKRSPLALFLMRGKDWKIMKDIYQQALKRRT
ncbi:MAG TPA: hypothetical protein VLJ68_07950, partial [Chitinophagaceae bacterium]|nr:hypothetical protein [Chitinophagaceae bacterium]